MSREIKVLHLEPTDVCQAACPQCAREIDTEFDPKSHHHLGIDQITDALSLDVLSGLDKMFMCGNYGDPAAGKNTLEIYRWFRSINPLITLGMNTNGALRNREWWRELAGILCQSRDYVVFSIDGLYDTNHIYRRGVSWEILMENVRAFIEAGGSAHWDMLIYQHNQHQVEQAEQLAHEMGFTWFRCKISKRPITAGIAYPVNWHFKPARNGIIHCHALQEQSVYIDAQGRMSPCCWLGSRQGDFIQDIEQVRKTWQTKDPHPVCRATCTVVGTDTNFRNQWQKEVQLC
jgi:MoaA/NifB/PqqE/SkfB family radical SAM enzyme